MFMKRFMTGMLSSNCYIIGEGGEAAVIDPGVDANDIVNVLEAQQLSLKYIILTHAHIDHIIMMEEVRKRTGAKVAVHEDDGPLLGNPLLNGAVLFGQKKVFDQADILVKEGDVLDIGGLKLEILHTPGHTPGSMCIKAEDQLFTGDTLFKLGVGRTDLGAGDHDLLIKSLDRLMTLEDGIKVHPGHGSATEIGYERSHNMYMW
jgi:glyoxylase-like metal-dependent hydrolase (beta-lactamase superfamily II)